MKWYIPVILGGGAAFFVLRSSLSPDGPYSIRGISDREWLARVVIMEAGDIGPSDEWGAIMQVAVNRLESSRYPNNLQAVVATTAWPGGGSRGEEFCRTIAAPAGAPRDSRGRTSPVDHPRWSAAYEYAGAFLGGFVPNRIGGRLHFCHRGAACSPDKSLNDRRTLKCVDGRYLPLWALPRTDPDSTAEYTPIVVGRAIFS